MKHKLSLQVDVFKSEGKDRVLVGDSSSGYIVSKISKTICCYPCVCALKHGDNDPLTQQAFQFLKRRESSSPNLCYPSNSVVKLVVASDKVFEREVELNKTLPKVQNLITCLTMKVMRRIDYASLFPTPDTHDQNPSDYEIHAVTIAKCVVKRFFRIRCLSYLKLVNQKQSPDPSIRNEIMKKLQFQGI